MRDSELVEQYKKLEHSYSWKIIFYLNVFLACVSFSIVLPSLWPYLQRFDADENFLAAVLAIYSIGEFLGSIIWGYIYNASSMKFSLYSCIAAGFIGSILYSMGGYFIPWGKWLVFVGRFIQGLWTGGQQAIEQAYITECIDKNENLSMIADLGASAVLGFVLGPIVGLIGGFINFNIGSFYIDEYTSCGYFQAIFCIIMFLGTLFLFTEIPREYRRGLQEEDEEIDDDCTVEQDEIKQDSTLDAVLNQDPNKVDYAGLDDEEKDTLLRLKPNMKGVLVSLLIFLIHFNGFAVQETITTPISTDVLHKYTDTLDYPESFAYILFACSGVLSLLTFIFLKRINELLSDKTFVMISSIMGLVGYFILIDFQPRIIEPVRFIIGFCIISVTFPLGRGVTLSMFSKIIGKHKAGVYMGYILAVGAISRIIGPFWSVQSLTVSPALTFGISALLFLINIIAQWWYNDCLNPHWSFYIDQFEETQNAKLGKPSPKRTDRTPPGVFNPYTASPGAVYMTPKKSASKKFKEKQPGLMV
jgi:ceroid-lipofuscinosis MFS transporter 7